MKAIFILLLSSLVLPGCASTARVNELEASLRCNLPPPKEMLSRVIRLPHKITHEGSTEYHGSAILVGGPYAITQEHLVSGSDAVIGAETKIEYLGTVYTAKVLGTQVASWSDSNKKYGWRGLYIEGLNLPPMPISSGVSLGDVLWSAGYGGTYEGSTLRKGVSVGTNYDTRLKDTGLVWSSGMVSPGDSGGAMFACNQLGHTLYGSISVSSTAPLRMPVYVMGRPSGDIIISSAGFDFAGSTPISTDLMGQLEVLHRLDMLATEQTAH